MGKNNKVNSDTMQTSVHQNEHTWEYYKVAKICTYSKRDDPPQWTKYHPEQTKKREHALRSRKNQRQHGFNRIHAQPGQPSLKPTFLDNHSRTTVHEPTTKAGNPDESRDPENQARRNSTEKEEGPKSARGECGAEFIQFIWDGFSSQSVKNECWRENISVSAFWST